jgi:Tol biopolymer transport system component
VRRLVSAILILVALAALAPAPAWGFGKNKINYQRFDWQIYKSPHFDVYYYPDEAPLLDQVVSYAESQYLRISNILDHEITFRIPLIYYKTHVEFEQTNILLSTIPEFVAAFADPIEVRMVLPVDSPPDKLYALIGHELTHVFEFSILFQQSLSRVYRSNTPGWIMEGLASHLGEDEDSFDKMIIRDAVVNGLIPPIHRVRGINFLTYRYGQAAFDFIEETYGSEGVRTFIWEFRKALLAHDIRKPIQDAFGIDGDEFDRQFKKYLQKLYLPTLLEKKEAEDYGREIATRRERERDRGAVTFSPALSPSGELIAVMTNRWEDLDVAIVSAKDGKVIRNLTKGFTNKYEYLIYGAFQGKKDITWSPDGNRVAFFARREDERILVVYDALSGDLEERISIPEVDDELSPAWSPDGRWIAFEGNRDGVVDIFALELSTRDVVNLTQDSFYDGNPSWSPDGDQLLYNRRINAFPKIFMVNTADPSRKVQLTFGDSADLQPSFSMDGKTVHYVSDIDGGIFNLHSLSLESGDIHRGTDVVGGVFTPLELPSEGGKSSIAFTSYSEGRFRLFRMRTGEPEEVRRPADQAQEPAELEPFRPPIQLSLDDENRSTYDKLKWHISSAPSVLVGVADDGTFLSNAQIVLSDLLGDHRMFFNFQSVSSFSNFSYQYHNLRNRFNWSIFAIDFREFFIAQSVATGATRRDRKLQSYTGAGAEISYPFNRYYRAGASAGYFLREIVRPISDPFLGTTFIDLEEQYPFLGWSLSGDTIRYKRFGPYHGQGFQLSQQWAPTLSASGDTAAFISGTFVNTFLDYRLYRRVTSRSLFALRLAGIVSNGQGSDLFPYGGLNQLRGYDYREFFGSRVTFVNLEYRFPLIDSLAFPFGAIRDIRGFFFLDIGTAWGGAVGVGVDSNETFYHPNIGFELTDPTVSFRLRGGARKFDFWDSKNNELGDGRAAYGFGVGFYIGPLRLTWTYAQVRENTLEVCADGGDGFCDPGDPRSRIDDPFRPRDTVTSFYIAREF